MEKRYLSCADTAKLVRKALAAEFPGQKFSVRSHTYAGGASIDVSWTDGPTAAQVDRILNKFESARFDGSIDMQVSVSHWLCPEHGVEVASTPGTEGSKDVIPAVESVVGPCLEAELVHFGSHYVMGQRTLSPEFRQLLIDDLEAALGVPYTDQLMAGWVTREGDILRGDSPREYGSTLVHQLAGTKAVTPEREVVTVAARP